MGIFPARDNRSNKTAGNGIGPDSLSPKQKDGQHGVLQLGLSTSLLVVRLTLLSPPRFSFSPAYSLLATCLLFSSPVPLCWFMGRKRERKKKKRKGRKSRCSELCSRPFFPALLLFAALLCCLAIVSRSASFGLPSSLSLSRPSFSSLFFPR